MKWFTEALESGDNAAEKLGGEAEDVGNKLKDTFEEVVETIQEVTGEAAGKLQKTADEATDRFRNIAQTAQQTFDRLSHEALRAFIDATKSLPIGRLPDPSLGSVNTIKFYTPVNGAVLVDAAVVRGDNPITIEIHEPEAIKVFSSLVSVAKQRAKESVFRTDLEKAIIASEIGRSMQTAQPQALGVVIGVGGGVVITATTVEILALASCITAAGAAIGGVVGATGAVLTGSILATGVAIFIILMAFAIIYALYEGYNIEQVDLTWEDGKPNLKIRIVKPEPKK